MQKKRFLAVFLMLALTLSLAASAAPRYSNTITCIPEVVISGTTASCTLTVETLSGAKIKATVILYKADGTKLKTWPNLSGTTSLDFSETYTVVKGNSYKLEATVTVTGTGGTDNITKYATAACR